MLCAFVYVSLRKVKSDTRIIYVSTNIKSGMYCTYIPTYILYTSGVVCTHWRVNEYTPLNLHDMTCMYSMSVYSVCKHIRMYTYCMHVRMDTHFMYVPYVRMYTYIFTYVHMYVCTLTFVRMYVSHALIAYTVCILYYILCTYGIRTDDILYCGGCSASTYVHMTQHGEETVNQDSLLRSLDR